MTSHAQFAQLRVAAGLSVEETADRIGRDAATIRSYEAGNTSVPVGDLRAMITEAALASGTAPRSEPSVGSSIVQRGSVSTDLFGEVHIPPGRSDRHGAFTDNMKLPVHRWFRYSAGFSAEWARSVINRDLPPGGVVLDPFAGSGTTLLAAQQAGAGAVGYEPHPFVIRVAQAKLRWRSDADAFLRTALDLLQRALDDGPVEYPNAPDLLQKCFSPDALGELTSLRRQIERSSIDESHQGLVWLALTSILRECSHVGTAQWQYVLPNRSKAKVVRPYVAFATKVNQMAADMRTMQSGMHGPASIMERDARAPGPVELQGAVDLVVTSPPYPNNYDYADATRLEMSFWGEISSWGELHSAVRNRLLCSCSQHSAADRLDLDELIADPVLDPIRPELTEVCRTLETTRDDKGGRKTYHTMVAAYFVGLAKVWNNLRPLVRQGGIAHFVIGDSAPYGVYVPCDRWLGELALAAGFTNFSFEKLRDRNTKWKNRKHTVPLKEGILTVRG